jgi:hypothetical protein
MALVLTSFRVAVAVALAAQVEMEPATKVARVA